ncbi:TLC domain-containing protein 2 [Ctenodactylus gundi]
MAPLGILMTGASFVAFRGLHWGMQLLPTLAYSAQDNWKWRNHFVSLIHSLLSGAAALFGLMLYPQMAADPIHDHPSWALVLVAMSVGYFLADGADLLWNQTLSQAWDILCHHLVVVSCLGVAVLSEHYMGFSVVSLLVEVNSSCLHLRTLLLLSHQVPSLAFSVVSWATLATMALFRLVPLGWMVLWLVRQHHQLPFALVILGGTGLAIVSAVSIRIGIRILIHDILKPQLHLPLCGHKKTKGTRTCNGEPVTKEDSTFCLKN